MNFDRRPRGRVQTDGTRINDQIRAREVRVISAEGEQMGIMSTDDAVRVAVDQGLDLVEVAAQSRPPVCRIMDYGKFKYAQKKKSQGSIKHAAGQVVKEVKLRPKTEEHDYQVKLRHIQRFLIAGAKVKVTVRFRGRELVHKDIGVEMLDRIVKDVGDLGIISASTMMEGRMLQMALAPSPKAMVIKRNKDEERQKAREAERLARLRGDVKDKPGGADGADEEAGEAGEEEEENEDLDDDIDDDDLENEEDKDSGAESAPAGEKP